jgi:hypothetical protein
MVAEHGSFILTLIIPRILIELNCSLMTPNKEVLHKVKEQRNILHTIKRRKAHWIRHILRTNCLLQHVTEGKLEG